MDFQPFNLADTLSQAENVLGKQQTREYRQFAMDEARQQRADTENLRGMAKQAVVDGNYDWKRHAKLLVENGYVDQAQKLSGQQMEFALAGLEFMARSAPSVRDGTSYARWRAKMEEHGLAEPGELPMEWNDDTQRLVRRIGGDAEEEWGDLQVVQGYLGQYDQSGKFRSVGQLREPRAAEREKAPDTRTIDGVLHEYRGGRWVPARRALSDAEVAEANQAGRMGAMNRQTRPQGGRARPDAEGRFIAGMMEQAGLPVVDDEGAPQWEIDMSLGYPVQRNVRTGEAKRVPEPPEGMFEQDEYKTDSIGNITLYRGGRPVSTLPLGASDWQPIAAAPGTQTLPPGMRLAEDGSLYADAGPAAGGAPAPAGGGGGGTFVPTPSRDDQAAAEQLAVRITRDATSAGAPEPELRGDSPEERAQARPAGSPVGEAFREAQRQAEEQVAATGREVTVRDLDAVLSRISTQPNARERMIEFFAQRIHDLDPVVFNTLVERHLGATPEVMQAISQAVVSMRGGT